MQAALAAPMSSLESKLHRLRTRLARYEAKADVLRARIAAAQAALRQQAKAEVADTASTSSSSGSSSPRAAKQQRTGAAPADSKEIAAVSSPATEDPTGAGATTTASVTDGAQAEATKELACAKPKRTALRGRPRESDRCRACVYREQGRPGGPRHTYVAGCSKAPCPDAV